MTMVWPALLPPLNLTTASTPLLSRSVALPLPSSPHWAPTSTIAGIRASSTSLDQIGYAARVPCDQRLAAPTPPHRTVSSTGRRVAVGIEQSPALRGGSQLKS